jgi:cobalt-zinc-cadmium efflux system protein
MGHDHPHGHGHGARGQDKRALWLVLCLTGAFTVAEVVGGLLTGSLALLADAGHMLSDAGSIALALLAIWLAERPATPSRSFGLQRAEILAALVNGLTLVVISLWIFWEAYHRLSEPPEVLGGPMLAVAVVGLSVNLAGAYILSRAEGDSLNVSAALRHVIADVLGSVGAITAAVIILLTGWRYADPLVSVVIGLLVLASAWPVLRDSLRVLLEAAPVGVDPAQVGQRMASAEGIREVHDLHIWTITSGFPALSAHVLVGPGDDCHARRRELERLLQDEFDIEHTTLQVDHESAGGLLTIESAEEGQAALRTRHPE